MTGATDGGGGMRIVRSQLFLDSFRAVQQGDPALFEVVAADLRYLLVRRRDAQLPQVAFRHRAVSVP